MERPAQRGTTSWKTKYYPGQLILVELLSIEFLIEMLTHHVDLGTQEVLQGRFLGLPLIDHLLLTMIMAMEDMWNDPQTIATVISVITVLPPAQSVPILQLSVMYWNFLYTCFCFSSPCPN